MAEMKGLKRARALPVPPSLDDVGPNAAPSNLLGRVDGRTLRRTNRTRQMNVRVTPEFDDWFREELQRGGMNLATLLEEMRLAYLARRAKKAGD